eukprot:2540251-Pleurochrysis_carterae.AAC.1
MAQQSMPTAKATSGRVCMEQYSSAPTRDWYEAKSLLSMKREGLLSSACSTSLDVGNVWEVSQMDRKSKDKGT